MKALSLWPEYAFEVLTDEKTIEYRTWSTNYRGDLLICSTVRKTPGTIPGHGLVVVELVDVVKVDEDDYEWILENNRPIYPIKVKGQLGLYTVDDERIKLIPDEIINGDQATFDKFWNEIYEPLIF